MKSRANLAANLTALMALHKMGQSELHRKCGVAQSTIGRILNQKTAADLDTLGQIASAFHLSGWQLISPPFDPTNPPVLKHLSDQERELYERLKKAVKELG